VCDLPFLFPILLNPFFHSRLFISPFSTPFPPSKIKENNNKKADVFKPFSQKKKSSERMQWAAEGERCSSLFPTPIFFLFRIFALFFIFIPLK
jgi:hypothetical protein